MALRYPSLPGVVSQFELDVPAHPLDELFVLRLPSQVGIEAEAGDQGLQPSAAQDLLADGV